MYSSTNPIYFAAFMVILSWFTSQVSSESKDCIILLSGLEGEMKSPNYPYTTEANILCTYKLNISSGWVYFWFDDFVLQKDDYLNISNNGKDIQSFTGKKVPFLLVAYSTSEIKFNTSNSTLVRKFHSTYSAKECSQNVQGVRGLLSSPVYPSDITTPNPVNCKWVIVTSPEEYYGIALSFMKFTIFHGKLSIYNGPAEKSTLIHNFTGNVLPPDQLTMDSHMTVVLHFDMNEKNISFQCEFNAFLNECSNFSINVTDRFTISLPLLSVFSDISCIWILQAGKNDLFLVNLKNPNFNNLDDSLIISDGPGRFNKSIAIYTYGMSGIPDLMTSGNELYIAFSTKKNFVQSTFTLDIETLVTGIVDPENGSFSFTPDPVRGNETVMFDLEVQPGKQVEATIQTKLNGSNEVFFYGILPNKTRLSLWNFTSNETLFPVFSISNQMIIEAKHFEKNDSFLGTFRGIIPGCDQYDDVNIGSYQLNDRTESNCSWVIKPSSGEMINLFFHSLNLGDKGHVKIYKGLAGKNEDFFITFNSSIQYYPSVVVPAADGVRVDTYLDKSAFTKKNLSQMSAFYEAMPGCTKFSDLKSGNMISLQSPGYPTSYSLGAKCQWSFQIAKNLSFILHFVDVDLYPSDSILIYSLHNESLKFFNNISGKGLPSDMLLSENITVKWNSSISNTSLHSVRGFFLNVEVLDCGANITKSISGQINIPGHNLTNQTLKCIWIIDVGEKDSKTGDVFIVDFHIHSLNTLNNNDNTSLEIFDGGSLSDKPLVVVTNGTSVLSRTNKILIKYTTNHTQTSKPLYNVTFIRKVCSKTHQCKNGVCMHDSWKCNGENNCGDYSDEDNCNSSSSSTGGVSTTLAVILSLLGFISGIALTMLAPFAIQKIRSYRQKYNDFHTLPDD